MEIKQCVRKEICRELKHFELNTNSLCKNLWNTVKAILKKFVTLNICGYVQEHKELVELNDLKSAINTVQSLEIILLKGDKLPMNTWKSAQLH